MKKIDVSVLPDNFLVELMHPENEAIDIIKKFKHEAGDYLDGGWLMRPCLGIDHFNDGSMVLPDGLVVETMEYHCDEPDLAIIADGKVCFLSLRNEIQGWHAYDMSELSDMCAVKILGVTAEYGAQLGMGVIEL